MRYNIFRFIIIAAAVTLFISLLMMPESAIAQCSMCKQALETGGNGNLLNGLKWSIVFMIIPPTLMTAGIGFLVIRSGHPQPSSHPNDLSNKK